MSSRVQALPGGRERECPQACACGRQLRSSLRGPALREDPKSTWPLTGRGPGSGAGEVATGTRDPRPRDTAPRRLANARALPHPLRFLPQFSALESERGLDVNQGKPRAVQLNGFWPAARALFVRRGPAKKALGGRGAPQLAAVTERVRGTMSWATTSRHRF